MAARSPLEYRRRAFPWLERGPLHILSAAPEPTCIAAAREASPTSRRARDGELVRLSFTATRAAILELNDTAHFNALGAELCSDLRKAIEFTRQRADLRGVVLQAAGPHFCIGANPHAKHVDVPLAELAEELLEVARSCHSLRCLSAPVVAAVHGHVVGGGIALSLNVAYRICEEQTTFEHGNLPRGVCPIAEFSQTLLRSVGRSAAMRSAWA